MAKSRSPKKHRKTRAAKKPRKVPVKTILDGLDEAVNLGNTILGEFDEALKRCDYPAAMAVGDRLRMVDGFADRNMRTLVESADRFEGERAAKTILDGGKPTKAHVTSVLRLSVLVGRPIPPAVALYAADLIEGKVKQKTGRKPIRARLQAYSLLEQMSVRTREMKEKGVRAPLTRVLAEMAKEKGITLESMQTKFDRANAFVRPPRRQN